MPASGSSGPPHLIRYSDPAGRERSERTRLVGDTLVWQRGGVLYRIESGPRPGPDAAHRRVDRAVGEPPPPGRCMGGIGRRSSPEEVLDMRHLTRVGAAALAALAALLDADHRHRPGRRLGGGRHDRRVGGSARSPARRARSGSRSSSTVSRPSTSATSKLTAVNTETGEAITVPATSLGGGRWSASITFPVEGNWQIGVRHNELADVGTDDADGRAGRPARLAAGRC